MKRHGHGDLNIDSLLLPCERTANSARFFNADSTTSTSVESRHCNIVSWNFFANLTTIQLDVYYQWGQCNWITDMFRGPQQ